MDGKNIEHALWVQVRNKSFSICVPPKCGSTALSIHLGAGGGSHGRIGEHYEMFTPSEAAKDEWVMSHPRYLVVRHPVERFASGWRDRVRDWDESTKKKWKGDTRHLYTGLSPSGLMAFVAQCPFLDIHFYPQHFWSIPGVTFFPAENYSMGLFGADVYARGTDVRDDDPLMPFSWIVEHYERDMEIYRRC